MEKQCQITGCVQVAIRFLKNENFFLNPESSKRNARTSKFVLSPNRSLHLQRPINWRFVGNCIGRNIDQQTPRTHAHARSDETARKPIPENCGRSHYLQAKIQVELEEKKTNVSAATSSTRTHARTNNAHAHANRNTIATHTPTRKKKKERKLRKKYTRTTHAIKSVLTRPSLETETASLPNSGFVLFCFFTEFLFF